MRKTYREWHVECDCGFTGKIWEWEHKLPLQCPTCKADTALVDNRITQSAGVIDDTYVGGLMVPHAICHADGSPRRVDSRTEHRRLLAEKGWTIAGETPKTDRNRWI